MQQQTNSDISNTLYENKCFRIQERGVFETLENTNTTIKGHIPEDLYAQQHSYGNPRPLNLNTCITTVQTLKPTVQLEDLKVNGRKYQNISQRYTVSRVGSRQVVGSN
jgi:hypothetical protein